MKLYYALLAVLMLSIPAGVLAQDDWIGLYADYTGMICSADLSPPDMVVLNVYAHVPSFPEGIRVAEFRVDNYPVSGAGGIIFEAWSSVLVIGSPGEEFFAIAWTEPQIPDANGNVEIGAIGFTAQDPGWIGDDYVMQVAESVPRDEIIVVSHDFLDYFIAGDQFTFNCSGFCGCLYLTTAAAESSWGSIKSLY